MWLLYQLFLIVGLLCYVPGALWRRRLPHAGWSMRLGRYPASVTQALFGRRSIWIHAVSVGEVKAVAPLIDALRRRDPERPLVLSTVTVGGYDVATRQLNGQATVIYFPLDLRPCIQRSLDALRPMLLVLMESELWPLMVHLTKRRAIPVVVVNGRISARAMRRYRWITRWTKRMLAQVDGCFMQTQVDADRIIELGAPAARVRVMGSLKWDASLDTRLEPEHLRAAAERIGVAPNERLIVAGSTHRGEEEVLLKLWQALRATAHEPLRLVIAPRHLERLAEIEALGQRLGVRLLRLSQAAPGVPWDVGLVDTFGQLSLYYGLATIVFIGGSLIPHGGQNPLEAASFGKPIVFGPFMDNFADIAQELISSQAAREVRSPEELSAVVGALLQDPLEASRLGLRARALIEQHRGVTSRILTALVPLLPVSMERRDLSG